jgi:hypothetical protein
MQYSVAILALAASVAATANDTLSYTTEVTPAYTTYCSAATQISYNGQTYTVTAVRTPSPVRAREERAMRRAPDAQRGHALIESPSPGSL